MQVADWVAGLLGFLFTLMVLSYLLSDNPLFRLAIYAFIGISAGYVAGIAVEQVILGQLLLPIGSAMQRSDVVTFGLLIIPLLMGTMLLMKLSPRLEFAGRPMVAFIIGVGAAAAVSGALLGTIFPQALATINLFDFSVRDVPFIDQLTEGIAILLGTVTTLAYFQFGVRGKLASAGKRDAVLQVIAYLGQGFLAITFGVLFAGVFSAALIALVNRVQALLDFLFSFF